MHHRWEPFRDFLSISHLSLILSFLLSIFISRGSTRCGTYEGFFADSLNSRLSTSTSFPWLVSLRGLNRSHLAVGTIISSSWIVSAPSSLHIRHNLQAVVGITHLGPQESENQYYPIRKVIVHPDFDEVLLVNDLLLLLTEQQITFGQWVQPICFPNQDPENNAFASCQVSGWRGPTAGGYQLEQTGLCGTDAWYKIPVDNIAPCPLRHNTATECFGYYGQDLSPGQEVKKGNPVSCKITGSERWVLAGVMTGNGIMPYGPFLYTRTSHYTDWLKACTSKEDDSFVPSVNIIKVIINGSQARSLYRSSNTKAESNSNESPQFYDYYTLNEEPDINPGHRVQPVRAFTLLLYCWQTWVQ
ncbi:inactive serine protease 54 [Pelobates cultripes]|uniref:Inactive serine protease 54 n=1 Tax=Pelobates cultripes TaxID=61616 RepID=A0AAD1TH57_PELCU|nr:inactive serine protease 54 [Pelobates cultripes]